MVIVRSEVCYLVMQVLCGQQVDQLSDLGISSLNHGCSREFVRTGVTPLDASGAETGTTKKAAKPKKKKTACKTIEQNLSNINVSEADRKCAVRKHTLSIVVFAEVGKAASRVGVCGLAEL